MTRPKKFIPPSASVVAPLPRARRRFLFLVLVFIFVCAMPIFAFYANGYRYNFWDANPTITTTGGLYVSVGNENGEVFLNDEPVTDSRVFRQALYIQGLVPGVKRLHVQAPGYHTWVKELPVYPHIVTEASAFLMPARPTVRPISEYQTSAGVPVYLGVASSTTIVPFASTTVPIIATSSKATTTLSKNSEYLVVAELFGTTSISSSSDTMINRVVDGARSMFETSSTSATSTIELATTTIVSGETTLFKRDDDVFVRFTGAERNVPYYFCIPEDVSASTSPRYAAQLIEARRMYASERAMAQDNVPAETILETTTSADRQCRREIRIDRNWNEVISFAFFPGSTDLVVMHRTDGVYVTEIDDRAWQNSQRVYPASATAVVVDGGRIFIKDGSYYFELILELPTA